MKSVLWALVALSIANTVSAESKDCEVTQVVPLITTEVRYYPSDIKDQYDTSRTHHTVGSTITYRCSPTHTGEFATTHHYEVGDSVRAEIFYLYSGIQY